MRLSRTFALLLSVVAGLLVPAWSQQSDITLSGLIEAALQGYSGLEAAELDRQAAHRVVDIRFGTLLPSVDFTGNIGEQRTSRAGFFPRKSENDVNSYDINLQLPLLALSPLLIYRSSKKSASAADADYETERQRIILETAQAFFSWHLASNRQALLETRQKRVSSQLQASRLLAEEDIGNYADVFLVQAQVAQVQALIENAGQDLRNSANAIRRLSGVFPDRLPGLDDDFRPPEPGQLEEFISAAMQGNSQIIAASDRVEEARLLLDAAHAAHQPRVNLVVQKNLGDSTDTMFYGAQVQIPLFSGLQTSAEAQRAALVHMASSRRLHELRVRVAEFIRNQHAATVTHVRNAATARETVSLRTEYLEKITEAWHEGFASTTEVLDATEELFNSQVELRAAHYGYFSALLQLHSTAGSLNEKSLEEISDKFRP